VDCFGSEDASQLLFVNVKTAGDAQGGDLRPQQSANESFGDESFLATFK
jgi:hypothetical protein